MKGRSFNMKFGVILVLFACAKFSMALFGLDLFKPNPVPGNLKQFGKDISRLAGCFLHRFWNDCKRIHCGDNANLADCICNNTAPFSGIIKEIGADIGGLGLSALCGAYEGGR
ncbi:hypothetical protein Bhyg_17097, partial [Pseudolycoriella hygida]